MKMPKLQPHPIKTQHYNFFIKLLRLIVRKRQWEVIQDWHYTLPNNRVIVIPKGFVFDGSSYPWIVWLIFSPTGLLLIPVMIHEFCYKHNYLWAVHGDFVYKFKPNNGFLNWNRLVRKVGIDRNELVIVDYFVWINVLLFGWVNWLLFQKNSHRDIYPENFQVKK